jgi:hypothetical protein
LRAVCRRDGPIRPVGLPSLCRLDRGCAFNRHRFYCRLNHSNGSWGSVALRLQTPALLDGRLSPIGLYGWLLSGKSHGRGRRRSPSHDCARLNRCRGPDRAPCRTEDALLLWYDSYVSSNLCLRQLSLIDFDHVSLDRLGRSKCRLGGCGNGTRRGSIDVPKLGNARIVCRVVIVDISNVRVVDRGVRHVDIGHIGSTRTIRRNINLTGTEREPCGADAADTDAKVRTANPSD